MRLPFCQTLLGILLCHASGGAEITWSPPVNTTDKSQLISGNIILAISGGTATTITGGGANGSQNFAFPGASYQDLNFAPAPGLRISNDVSNNAASTGDADFDTLLKSFTDTESGITTGTQTISGLTNGTSYRVQVFYNDQRAGLSGRTMTYGDGSASPNTQNVNAGGSGWGQHAVGTFIADGPTQQLTHATNGFGNVHFNAILVTAPGAPAPPEVPTGLIAAPGNERLFLDWDDNTQFGFSTFRISRSTSPGGPYSQVAETNESFFSDTGLSNGTSYYYVISAINVEGDESETSDEVSGVPEEIVEPPNFVFIIADDMDTYTINAYRQSEPAETSSSGQPYPIDTPNLDRLAAEGMLFHQARLMGADSGAVCTPSRTCIMTGKNTWERTNGVSAATTFPGVFNRGARTGQTPLPHATYRTCKTGNSYPIANNEFTIVNDATKRGNTNNNGSEWHADRALEHLEHWRTNHRPVGKPFLMYFGLSHPHDERNARPELLSRYGCINTSSPASVTLNNSAPPLPINHLPIAEATGIPSNYPFHPFDHGHFNVRDEVAAPGMLQYRNEAVTRNEIGRNFACVDWIDQQIGRVFERLEDPDGDGDTSDSILDNTYIVFTSDHGIAIGRHGLQGKQNLYEHTWRVPYIVRGPGIAAGSRTNALIYLHDSFPTFCDLAGLDLPATIDENDGQSFRAVLEGTSDTHRDHLFGLYAGGAKPGIRAITDGRFKLIKYDVGNNSTQVTQLFDLQENPYELLPEHGVANLADEPGYARVRQKLEEMLSKQRIENNDPYPFLGDRTLLRFEEGSLDDRFPFQNNATALSGNQGALPTPSIDVPASVDFLIGESNTTSLSFDQDSQNYLQIPDVPSLDFGNNPFTIEAWVKLEVLPTGADLTSTMPIVAKKPEGAGDADLDYMFLAVAGHYGSGTTFDRMALHLGSTIIISSLAIPDTEWHHLSVALDPASNTVRFTLDDQVDTQTTTATGTANNGPLVIGVHFNSSSNIDSAFDGLLDEFSITDGFLSLSGLQPLRNLPSVGDFRITDFQWEESGESFELTFESTPRRLYNLEVSLDLSEGSWQLVRESVPSSQGATTTLDEIPSPGQRAFYRISAQ